MNEVLSTCLPSTQHVDLETQVTVLLAILDGITGYAFNPDAWWLAYHDAERQCAAMGISPEAFTMVKDQFQTYRRARKARDPLASLHEPG